MHDHGEAGAGAVAVDLVAGRRAAPLGDAGAEHLGTRQRLLAALLDEAVDIVGLPEVALEGGIALADAADPQRMGDDDRPGPDAGEDEPGHHRLDDDVGPQEQGDRGEAAARQLG